MNFVLIIIGIIPFCYLAYRLIIRNAQSVFNSITYFEEIVTLYFSQYHLLVLSKSQIKETGTYLIRFLFSWFIIVFTIYTFTVFCFTYIFDAHIKHPDTLLMLIAVATIGIRLFVLKKGRQRSEILSWIMAIILFSWLIVGLLSSFYLVIKKPLIDYGLDVITNHFSTEIAIQNILMSNLPNNPFAISLAFLFFIFSELHFFKKIEPSLCGPWSLCYEIDSDIKRIIGRDKILSLTNDIISNAKRSNREIIWVTTTLDNDVLNMLKKKSKSNAEIVVIGENIEIPDNLPKHINIRHSDYKFPRGFLLIPGKEVLMTAFPVRGMTLGNPNIGFHTEDISVVMKFFDIFNYLK